MVDITNKSYPKRVLFFFPFFGYSGSEIMLLDFVKSLDCNFFEPYIYLFMKGALIKECPENIPYYLPYREQKGIKNWIKRKTISKKNNNYFIHQLKDIQNNIKADIWYVNTLAADPGVYEIAKTLNVKVVTHIHELLFAYSTVSSKNLKNILSYSDYCICCSQAAAHHLNLIGYTNTLLQYNFIDTQKINKVLTHVSVKRSDLGITDDEFVWIVSARTTYMKGISYLLEILDSLGDGKYKIIWIGDNVDSSLLHYVKSVVETRHPNKVIFTGELIENYYAYFNLGDALLIPSKEESFSLVALEAAYLGIPILSFEYGAAQEVIKEGLGTIINSWNIEDLVNGMRDLMKKTSPNQPKTINKNLKYTKEIQVPQFNQLLKTIANN